MKALYEEVFFKDFLHLQLLRLKFPSVFEHISKNFYIYFTTKPVNKYKHQYILKTVEKRSNNSKSNNYELGSYLSKNRDCLFIDEEDIENIVDLLVHIFDKHKYDNNGKQDHLSVVFPLQYRKYFSYNLGESSISEVAFTKARTSTQEEFNSLIQRYVEAGMEHELLNRFNDIRDFNNKEDFEKVITAIFFFGKQKSKRNYNDLYNVGYDASDLMDKLSDYDHSISRKYYNSKTQSEEYKSFLAKLLNDAEYPYAFESTIISEWLKKPSDNLPLSKDELNSIVVNLFEKYCKVAEKLDDYLWSFFNDCKIYKYDAGNEVEVFSEKAKEVFRDFILQKDIDAFLRDLISVNRREEGKYTLNDYVLRIWDTWENFIAMLEENRNKGWKYIPEFLQFYQQVASEGFGNYIKFNFKTIPIKREAIF
ncbi:hypothetical protein AAE02nite_21220 [Adhaeribacter aerolatus]|uniref:Uncharacterized protein n=2 Tax=Adhaeribacter aerolatus TaxID=670289 RepID=A0A512AXL4_9BACT|nr:hypothetical protein AAE02nite_21220 [Adhaeribacter aerolatus]